MAKKREKAEPDIMKNNSARFSLTEKNPLMSKHMSTKLGYLAETEYASDIMKEKFVPNPDVDEHTIFFNVCHQNKEVKNGLC